MPLLFYKVSIDFTEFVRPEPKSFTHDIVVQAASESSAAQKAIDQFEDLELESGVGWQRRIDKVTVTVCEPPAVDEADVRARDRERGLGVIVEKACDVVREFIDVLANISDLAYLRVPDGLSPDEVAGYLLMVASIDEQADAGRVHDLFRGLWDEWDRRVFRLEESDRGDLAATLKELTARHKPGRWIGLNNVAQCLVTASQYFQSHDGRLIDRAGEFQSAEEMVNDIADHVFRMGQDRCGARKKVWMYMRWMVRSAPDRALFKNFDSSELVVPLDGNVARALLLISEQWDHPHLQSLELSSGKLVPDAKNAQIATRFARDLFPDDPVRVDYPLFLLGRSRTGQSAKDSCRSKLELCRLGELLDCKCEARSAAATRLLAHLARPRLIRNRGEQLR